MGTSIRSLAVDASENLYALFQEQECSPPLCNVAKLSPTSQVLYSFDAVGRWIATSRLGYVYVLDSSSYRILRFGPESAASRPAVPNTRLPRAARSPQRLVR